MATTETGKKILGEALDKFRKNTGLNIEIEPNLHRADKLQGIRIRIVWNDLEYFFAVEIKNNITNAMLGGVLQQLNLYNQKGILVTRYINPIMADKIKHLGIAFLDTAGNAYIDEPPLLIFIKGNRPTEKHYVKLPTRTFKPTGLKVIFALLCNQGLETAPYREIAKEADVALGTVGWTMYNLKNLGYLIETDRRNRRLIRKEELLNKWVTLYPEQLRPKEMLGRYRTDDPNWWKHADIENMHAFWGGEVAAATLTEYLKPQIVTLYAKLPLGEFLLKNRLKEDYQGDVEILNVFWEFEFEQAHKNLTPPLLIYADLLATGDPRNIETARMIYEQDYFRSYKED